MSARESRSKPSARDALAFGSEPGAQAGDAVEFKSAQLLLASAQRLRPNRSARGHERILPARKGGRLDRDRMALNAVNAAISSGSSCATKKSSG